MWKDVTLGGGGGCKDIRRGGGVRTLGGSYNIPGQARSSVPPPCLQLSLAS